MILAPSKTSSIASKHGQKVAEQQKYSTIKNKQVFEFNSVNWFRRKYKQNCLQSYNGKQ
jgi:hypothetical protein